MAATVSYGVLLYRRAGEVGPGGWDGRDGVGAASVEEGRPASVRSAEPSEVGPGEIELLIAHPGGPFWAKKDEGAWSIPKGFAEPGESPEEAARREFAEETGTTAPDILVDLGTVTQKAGKTVHAFAGEGDLDPDGIVSNTVTVVWPPRSGRFVEVPEIDRAAWVGPDEARRLLNPAQAALVRRLLDHLSAGLR